MALQTVLLSPGVKVTATTQAVAPIPTPTTIPLIFIATRANKPAPDGSGIALGTVESNVMRIFTSQSDLLQAYGNPVFVTSDGVPVQGDETNEVGLITAYSVCGITSIVYVVRADIDLGQLVQTTIEPTVPPPDGTYWIESDAVIGGIFRYDGTNWNPVPFKVYTQTPGSGDGLNGDWAFDYSTLNGTIKFKAGGTWYPASTVNLTVRGGAIHPLYVQTNIPVDIASQGDYWYKTNASQGGTDLKLSKYRASDAVWVAQTVNRLATAPSPPLQNVVWENTSTIAADGNRPLYIGTGVDFIPLTVFVQDTSPVATAPEGTLWYDDTITDFALYKENGNVWFEVETTDVSNPSNSQKVISASPPQFPQQDAIWVDVSTSENIYNFPVLKSWTGSAWETIPRPDAASVNQRSVYIQSDNPIASLIVNGSYWLNTGESKTRFIIKRYDLTFVAHTVNDSHQVVVETGNYWEPVSGDLFGRKGQRHMVASALKQVIATNQEIRSEVNYYQLIACPGYVETYPDISSLNEDNNQISLALFDPPKHVIASGIPVGIEMTLTEWITNANNATEIGEFGFIGSPDPYQANAYPGGLATNPTDGQNVYVPPSYIMLRTIAYNDSVAYPWSPPAGPNRGLVTNVASVGYISDDNEYVPFNMNRPQRDIAYTNSINPIANIPNIGLCVWGQKTMAIAGSILDRINVVRLICKMKYDFVRLMEPFLFELNNATTRRNVTIVAQRYLAGLASLQAIYDYAVLCDDSNNTGATIAEHKLIVDVAIKPELSIEFIYVPILVLNPGDQFPY